MTRLQTFFLRDTSLTRLPAEIGQLTSLVNLDLQHNRLTRLPAEIGQLASLITLNATENQLTHLPPEIGQLSSLHTLDLNTNNLTALPGSIGRLTTLALLYVENNPLTRLPVELGQLSNLYSVTTPPLSFPPMEIQQQGTPAIVAYLRDYESLIIRQTIALIAAGVGGIALLILAFRWRQRRGLSEKKKRV